MNLPDRYKWLEKETGPKMILEGLKIYGIHEYADTTDNPIIIEWASEVGLQQSYNHDEIAWCGLAMAVIAKRAGKPIPVDPLWALNWALFGIASPVPMLGDVLTFRRPGGGHVGLYVGEDVSCFHVLAGNQHDEVNITRILKIRLFKARRPIYKVQPANVRRIFMSAEGNISTNER